jgi:hypothetical protein
MKLRIITTVLSLLLVASFSVAQRRPPVGPKDPSPAVNPAPDGRKMTLGEARVLLVGKRVTILDHGDRNFHERWGLIDWYAGVDQDGQYKMNLLSRIPVSYLGQEAAIIAIQPNAPLPSTNALGEKNDDASLINPYCDVVITLSDGTVAMTSTYLSLAFSQDAGFRPFTLIAENDQRRALIIAQLPTVVGKTVYAVAYSKLYPPTASLEAMIDDDFHQRILIDRIPRLIPLSIVTAKYLNEKDVIVLKLKSADGAEYLAFSRFPRMPGGQSDFLETLVRSDANLITWPAVKELTQREIAAIKEGKIVVGMSTFALYCILGLPDKENNWGRGGKQLIYLGGRLFVYLNANDHVTDFQSLDK